MSTDHLLDELKRLDMVLVERKRYRQLLDAERDIERAREVIAHYTEAVEEGSRFSALVDLVPGLETADWYPDRPPQRLVDTARLARLEAIERAYAEESTP